MKQKSFKSKVDRKKFLEYIKMANVSDVKQLVQNTFTNDINTQFDINLSNNCLSSTDATQTMENLKLKGVSDVDITQRNKVQNLCAFKTMLDMNIIQNLSAQAQSNLLDKLNSTVGIGAAVSSKNQDIINTVKNTVNTKAFVDASSKCMQQALQTQKISNVSIEDSKNIKLGQINEGINSCITNAAQQVGVSTESKTTTESKAESETTLKGFDPLAALGNIFAGLASFGLIGMLSPIIGICCCCIVCIGLIMLLGGSSVLGGKGGEPSTSDMSVDSTGSAIDSASSAYDTGSSALSLLSKFKKGGAQQGGGDMFDGVTEQMIGRTFLIIEYIGRALMGIQS
jgi:DNA polymerase III alpha subunit (gram-positive type)